MKDLKKYKEGEVIETSELRIGPNGPHRAVYRKKTLHWKEHGVPQTAYCAELTIEFEQFSDN